MSIIAANAPPCKRVEGSEQGTRESAQKADELPPGEWECSAASERRADDEIRYAELRQGAET